MHVHARPHWTVSMHVRVCTNPYCESDCIVARASLIYADYLCGKYTCGEPIDNDSRQSSLAWGCPLNSMLSPLPQSTMLTITCHVYSNCFRNPARPGGTIHGNFLPPGCSRRVGRVQVSGKSVGLYVSRVKNVGFRFFEFFDVLVT